MPIEKIIVVEDDLIVRKNLEQQLRNRRYDVAAVDTLSAANDYLARDNWDLMLVDVRLPDGVGTELLRELASRPQKPLVVMMSGFGTVESAVECMREGAFDYLIKPFSNDQLDAVLKKAEKFSQLVKVNEYLSNESDEASGHELLGQSAVMESLRALIRKVARTNATVMIQGESGTGKELVAHQLHDLSSRRRGPFVAVNCAALVETLLEAELFGIEDRTATGVKGRRGKFEHADGGTLFLDEVADLSMAAQAKLLRAIQDLAVERVGGHATRRLDVRIIAATNKPLVDLAERGLFRSDLYYRLGGLDVHVPPLRSRREDILELAHYFLACHGERSRLALSTSAADALQAYLWPGNVRELQRTLEGALAMCGSRVIDLDDLPPALRGPYAEAVLPSLETNDSLRTWASRYTRLVLARSGHNKRRACRALGISYHTLQAHLRYGAARARPRDVEDDVA